MTHKTLLPRQPEATDPGEALEIVQDANSDSNMAELRAETKLLQWLTTFYGHKHPNGGDDFNDHAQLILLDYYMANPDQARTECEAAGTPLMPGTLYLDPHDDTD